LIGLACAAGGGSLIWSLVKAARSDAEISGIFKGDAPTGKVWDAWVQRGWVKEGYHYLKLGSNVQCKICPNNCILAPDDRSHCRNRVNKNGTLYTMAYGNPCTFHIDPVEKKPLFHFLPGSATFSLATAGCVFRCLNCQNWEISQKKPEDTKDPTGPSFRLRPPVPQGISLQEMSRLSMFPEDVVALAEWTKCHSIAYTYSEPTAFYEYTYDTCKLARAKGIKNILVTCGSIEERALRDLGQYVDAAHVDLKGFSDETYRRLNSGTLQAILRILKTFKSMGVWVEIINLVVPTYTDDVEMIKRMSGWIAGNLGADQPLHFSRFHPAHKLAHLPPTPVEILLQARAVAQSEGLHYAYIGNVPGLAGAGTTLCPNCKRVVVERDIYAVTAFNVRGGQCQFCHARIAGVWS
jgi:pyruvate formate lyase activating enzyme